MKVKIQKISSSVLYGILAISLVILGLFFFGGTVDPNAEMIEPVYTDPLIYWMYALLGVTIAITLAAAIFQLISNFMDAPKEAIKSLVGVAALVVLLIFSWVIASGEPLVMPAYDGAENVPFWLKLTDMFLYTIYFMMGAMILLIFGFSIAKKFK
ncbi:MAG: hypothetical protein RR319_03895 [Bacteroides sp.]